MTPASVRRRCVVRARFSILAAGLLVCAISGLVTVAPWDAGTAAAAHGAAAATGTAGGVVPCPVGTPPTDTCAGMPSSGGLIVAGPTQNLGLGQNVYLQMSGFGAGDTAIVAFCSDPNNAPLPQQDLSSPPPPPICAASSPQYNAPPYGGIPIFNTTTGSIESGTAATSVETEEASPPGIPLQGNNSTTFYCDSTAANACDVVITDFALTASQGDSHVDAANSVAIPLTFAPPASCPGAPQVTSESEYGIEALTPTLARLSCAQNSPSEAVVPLDTAVGGVTAVSDLAAGNTEIAFTDDPESPDQQQALKSGNFALIPVALTANVVSVDAQIRGTGQNGTKQSISYPIDEMELTPTMVSGEITNQGPWLASYDADNQDACSGPSEDPSTHMCGSFPCGVLGTNLTCSLFDQLNYLAGYNNFFQSGSFMQGGTSGATDQLFTWLCNAPVVPLNFGTHPKESHSGRQVLETGFFGKSGPTVKCPAGQDTVPAFTEPPNFFTYNNPETQNVKAPVWVMNVDGAAAADAFINQNWAEGEYYGVGAVASLQNAAGNFVQPNATSLDAALQVALTNPDGTLTPDYTSTNADAYPMPDVIYAAVSTNPVPATQASAETAELTQMLALTGTGGSNVGQLPAGFVPLPANLVSQAQAEIQKDIVAEPPTTVVVIPSDGATQSGRAALLEATASADVTRVNFKLTGGPENGKVVAVGHLTSDGWLGRWNTTKVPNGTYTLRSVAFYADGAKGTSAPITISVDNPPPKTKVVSPTNNARVSGNQSLHATASPGVTQVDYELSGGPSNLSDDVIATGTATLDGWSASWNTSGVANGTYTLQSVASYAGGVSGTSAPITVTVSN